MLHGKLSINRHLKAEYTKLSKDNAQGKARNYTKNLYAINVKIGKEFFIFKTVDLFKSN